MKIYEVFACVPYCDPDYNQCYDRRNGVFFTNYNDARMYLDRMFGDKNANYKLKPETDGSRLVRRYITLEDRQETEISWDEFCRMWDMPQKQRDALYSIFANNWLVDEIKKRDAILLAVTYGGNKWFLRETEIM